MTRVNKEYKSIKKTLHDRVMKGLGIKNLAMSYFRMGTPTLSSALSVFTSEFEMESGGSHLLLSPGNWLILTMSKYVE